MRIHIRILSLSAVFVCLLILGPTYARASGELEVAVNTVSAPKSTTQAIIDLGEARVRVAKDMVKQVSVRLAVIRSDVLKRMEELQELQKGIIESVPGSDDQKYFIDEFNKLRAETEEVIKSETIWRQNLNETKQIRDSFIESERTLVNQTHTIRLNSAGVLSRFGKLIGPLMRGGSAILSKLGAVPIAVDIYQRKPGAAAVDTVIFLTTKNPAAFMAVYMVRTLAEAEKPENCVTPEQKKAFQDALVAQIPEANRQAFAWAYGLDVEIHPPLIMNDPPALFEHKYVGWLGLATD